MLDMVLPNGESKSCTLHDVLYVPTLSYNLLSVAKASHRGKIVKFTKSACYRPLASVGVAIKLTCNNAPSVRAHRARVYLKQLQRAMSSEYFSSLDYSAQRRYLEKPKIDGELFLICTQ